MSDFPVSIFYKSIAGRYRPVKVGDGPITASYRFIKNASLGFRLNAIVQHQQQEKPVASSIYANRPIYNIPYLP